MGTNLQLSSSYSQSADYISNKLSTVVADIQQRQEATPSQTPASVVEIDFKDLKSDLYSDLSPLEAFRLSLNTANLSPPFSRWLEDLNSEERKDILDLGSQSFYLEFQDFLEQAQRLDGEDRSRFIKAGARMGPGSSTLDLSKAVSGLSGDNLENFLETADRIGQSEKQDAIESLMNFVSAAGESPFLANDLVNTAAALENEDDETNLHNFLAAAAGAGEDLKELIETTEDLKSRDLKNFLGAAAFAGDGIGHLIATARDLDGEEQNRFLVFAAELAGDGDAENFILAAQDEKMELNDLMDITEKLNGNGRSAFLKLAANHDVYDAPIHRLAVTLETLGPGTTQANDFLLSALHSGEHVNGLINLVEGTAVETRTDILKFTADLSQADLANYLRAVEGPETDAFELAATALDLDSMQQSHFLYAASIDSSVSGLLTSLTRELKGEELEAFLYTAANKTAGLAGFLDTAQSLNSAERGEFISIEREALGTETNNAQKYVFLKSIFDEDLFLGIAGTDENMETMVESMDSMDAVQMDAFISVADKLHIHNGTKRPLPELLSVIGKLEGDDLDAFMEKAGSLSGSDQASFIIYADAVTVPGQDQDNSRLYRLIDLEENFGNEYGGLNALYTEATLLGDLQLDKKACFIGCVCSSCLAGERPSFENAKSIEDFNKIVRLTSAFKPLD